MEYRCMTERHTGRCTGRFSRIIQIIFQDSTSSLNPRMKVKDIITEPLVINRIRPKRGTYREEAAFQMKYVGLDESLIWISIRGNFPADNGSGWRLPVQLSWNRSC